MQKAGENKPLSPHDNSPLRLALEILSSHALNHSEIISILAEGNSPARKGHLHQKPIDRKSKRAYTLVLAN